VSQHTCTDSSTLRTAAWTTGWLFRRTGSRLADETPSACSADATAEVVTVISSPQVVRCGSTERAWLGRASPTRPRYRARPFGIKRVMTAGHVLNTSATPNLILCGVVGDWSGCPWVAGFSPPVAWAVLGAKSAAGDIVALFAPLLGGNVHRATPPMRAPLSGLTLCRSLPDSRHSRGE